MGFAALVLLETTCLGLQLAPALRPAVPHRADVPQMKGKGTRGLPGNRGGFSGGGGMTAKSKQSFERADFENPEWTLVAEKGELGAESGSTLAVEAGQSPQGQAFIWTLVRGVPQSDEEGAPESTVYATDGSCRCCLFPMTKGTAAPEDDGFSLKCGLCGTKYSLDNGEVLDWLPKENPAQMMAAVVNKDKPQDPCTVLRTRVSKAGRTYVRLPDGTLPITTRRVEGTINEMEEVKSAAPTKKKSTSKKARRAAKV